MPTINKDKCTGCGQCIDMCPFDAISLENNKAVIDASACRGCNQCIRACPVGAINP
ncbi:MAG: 4Fe-4S binding protein [Halanaerobiales bacterium]